jgi:hypothetical protein
VGHVVPREAWQSPHQEIGVRIGEPEPTVWGRSGWHHSVDVWKPSAFVDRELDRPRADLKGNPVLASANLDVGMWREDGRLEDRVGGNQNVVVPAEIKAGLNQGLPTVSRVDPAARAT